MCAPLLALMLCAAPASPVVVSAEPAAIDGLRAFLAAAAAHAPALEPAPLGRSLGTDLALDLLDRSAWPSAGLDPSGTATAVVLRDGATVLLLPVKDAKRAQGRAQLGLQSQGTVGVEKAAGVTTLTARAATAVQGKVAFAKSKAALWLGGGDPARLPEALAARAPSPERARGLKGPLTVLAEVSPHAGIGAGLSPHGSDLDMDVRLAGEGPLVARGVESALGKLTMAAPLFLRADGSALALEALRGTLLPLLHGLLPAPAREGLRQLTALFSGPAAWVVTGLDPGVGQGSDQLFVLRQALAAEVQDPAQAQERLDALLAQAGGEALPLPAPGKHARIRLGGHRELLLGLSGRVLYLATDASARDGLLAALPTAQGTAATAGEVVLDGPRAAQLLGKVSILDAARSPLLAGIFAVAVEGGPLLKALGLTRWTIAPDPKGARVTGTLHVAPRQP